MLTVKRIFLDFGSSGALGRLSHSLAPDCRLSGEEKVKEKETAEALLPCLNLYTETKALHMVYGAQKAANSMKLPRGTSPCWFARTR